MRFRISPKLLNVIFFILAFLAWVGMGLFFIYKHIIYGVYDPQKSITVGYEFYMLYTIFLGANLIFFERVFGRIEKLDVLTLLWRLFFIGMVCVGIMLISIISLVSIRTSLIGQYIAPILFFVNLYALLIFFLSAIFIFKRFILYQRTQNKILAWQILLALLGLGTLFPLFLPLLKAPWSYTPFFVSTVFIVITIYLGTSVRWVTYLNFNQKLRSLGLFALIVIVSITCFAVMIRFPDEMREIFPSEGIREVFGKINQVVFIYYIMIFTAIYSCFSILVLFFNLPTSSIFELNSLKIASVQKINQAIQSNLDFTEITNSLLDASLMASNAKAGWLEMLSEITGEAEIKNNKRISKEEIRTLKQGHDLTGKVLKDRQHLLIKNTRRHKAFKEGNSKMRTLLAVPISSNNHEYGAIYVVNELTNSFEDETIQSIKAFAEQAGMALENAQLVQESIEMERYQEQLKIAKDVQNELLPSVLPLSDKIEFVAISETADEVGGDYFDIVQSEDVYRVAIGDVSGKGTTAAFYMAETKGIFHALTQMNLSSTDFVNAANQALSRCMQKGFFMSLTYLQIDLSKGVLELLRAGHCPSFYYSASNQELQMLTQGTIGLGIVRNESYKNYLQSPQCIPFQSGDMVILYTDGIVESRDREGEEFGYKRLSDLIEDHIHLPAQELAENIVSATREFSAETLDDDYTVLIIKFR